VQEWGIKMRIVVINGGTRNGNTWRLTKLVEEELLTLSDKIEFDEIQLKELNLPFCTGCSLCFRKGHSYCPHNEIMQLLMDKIEQCDGLIFSAPTYNMQIPALGKNLIDHLCFMLHRPRYFDKKGLVISTTGGVGAGKATKYVADTLLGIGFNRCYQLPVNAISWNDYKPSAKDHKMTKKIAEKFYHDLESRVLHVPALTSVMIYNLFRGISTNYQKGSEYETQDGDFWSQKGYVNTCYAPQVPVPFYKKGLGMLFFIIAKKASKKLVVTYKK
jgi:Multimeric flavodoxin WrbA